VVVVVAVVAVAVAAAAVVVWVISQLVAPRSMGSIQPLV